MSDPSPDHTSEKDDLRAELLQLRRNRTLEEIEAARAAVRSAVLARHQIERWATVAAYRPLRSEPGSPELLAELVGRGVRVLVPVTLPDNELDWVALPGDEPLTVDAIATADAVLVPALAVGPDGTRLGRGGGSYDRALTRARPGTTVAALLYDGELVAHVPRDGWDKPVTAHVTPALGWVDL